MEQRTDALYWINEALTIQGGEDRAEAIAMELAKKNGETGKQTQGNRGRSR